MSYEMVSLDGDRGSFTIPGSTLATVDIGYLTDFQFQLKAAIEARPDLVVRIIHAETSGDLIVQWQPAVNA